MVVVNQVETLYVIEAKLAWPDLVTELCSPLLEVHFSAGDLPFVLPRFSRADHSVNLRRRDLPSLNVQRSLVLHCTLNSLPDRVPTFAIFLWWPLRSTHAIGAVAREG